MRTLGWPWPPSRADVKRLARHLARGLGAWILFSILWLVFALVVAICFPLPAGNVIWAGFGIAATLFLAGWLVRDWWVARRRSGPGGVDRD